MTRVREKDAADGHEFRGKRRSGCRAGDAAGIISDNNSDRQLQQSHDNLLTRVSPPFNRDRKCKHGNWTRGKGSRQTRNAEMRKCARKKKKEDQETGHDLPFVSLRAEFCN